MLCQAVSQDSRTVKTFPGSNKRTGNAFKSIKTFLGNILMLLKAFTIRLLSFYYPFVFSCLMDRG